MALFDGLTQALLRRTPSGAKVLTILGRPRKRFLVTPEQEASLKRLETWFYIAMLIATIVSLQIFPWIYLFVILTPLAILVHFAVLACFARRLTPTDEIPETVSRSELMRRQAQATGKPFLVFGLLISVGFVAMGIFLLSAGSKGVAWTTIAFFSLTGLVYVTQLVMTRRAR